MLGMPTIKMDVRMRRMSKKARPNKRMLMELTMAGLTKDRQVSHGPYLPAYLDSTATDSRLPHRPSKPTPATQQAGIISLFVTFGLILTCQAHSRDPKLKNLIINLHLFCVIPFSSEN